MPSRMESSARRIQRAKSNGLSCPQLYTATEVVAPNLGLKTSIQAIHIFPNYWSLLWSEVVRTHLYHLEPQVLLCHKPRFQSHLTSGCSKWQGLAGYCQVSHTCDPHWGLRPLRVHDVDKNSHHVKFSLVDEPHRLQDSEVTGNHTPISIYLQGWVSKFCNHHRWNNRDINPLSEKWWPPAPGILGKETCTTCFTSHQIHQTTTNNNRVVTSGQGMTWVLVKGLDSARRFLAVGTVGTKHCGQDLGPLWPGRHPGFALHLSWAKTSWWTWKGQWNMAVRTHGKSMWPKIIHGNNPYSPFDDKIIHINVKNPYNPYNII